MRWLAFPLSFDVGERFEPKIGDGERRSPASYGTLTIAGNRESPTNKRAETVTWHEQQCWRPTKHTQVSAIGDIRDQKTAVHQVPYLGLLCCRHRRTVSQSLYRTRCGMPSQCTLRRRVLQAQAKVPLSLFLIYTISISIIIIIIIIIYDDCFFYAIKSK